MDEYKIRYRHLDGDVGPLSFGEQSTVSEMKAAILESWPTEGAIADKVRRGPHPCVSLVGRPGQTMPSGKRMLAAKRRVTA